MSESSGIPYFIEMTVKGGAGDVVCLLSACREFARRTGNPVYTDQMPDVVETYRDPNLRVGTQGVRFSISPQKAHRIKEAGDYGNYYGTYLASMGLLRKGDFPTLDLPVMEKMESYAVIQPISVFAKNPSLGYLQALVDNFRKMTGKEVYVIGKKDTPRTLKDVHYDLLQDSIVNIMKVIQSASFVMAPRSLSAHLAAGYGRPAFIWVQDDGENWHLNYNGWGRVLHSYMRGEIMAAEVLQLFLKMQGIV